MGASNSRMVRFRTKGISNIADAAKYVKAEVALAVEMIATVGALEIENQCKIACPVRTGNLRRSITHQTMEKSHTRAVVIVGPDGSVTYAPYVEFGTSHMAAQPFMRSGYEVGKPLAVAAMREESQTAMMDAIETAAAKSASRRRGR